MSLIYLKRAPESWHAVHAARPGGSTVFLCGLSVEYSDEVAIATDIPVPWRCVECERAWLMNGQPSRGGTLTMHEKERGRR